LAIIARTGYVWHPMGMPSGLAQSSRALADSNPAATVSAATVLKNALLERASIPRHCLIVRGAWGLRGSGGVRDARDGRAAQNARRRPRPPARLAQTPALPVRCHDAASGQEARPRQPKEATDNGRRALERAGIRCGIDDTTGASQTLPTTPFIRPMSE